MDICVGMPGLIVKCLAERLRVKGPPAGHFPLYPQHADGELLEHAQPGSPALGGADDLLDMDAFGVGGIEFPRPGAAVSGRPRRSRRALGGRLVPADLLGYL